MPVESQAQAGLMGADLARAKKGESTKTGMKQSQLEEWLRGTKKSSLPKRKNKRESSRQSGR